MKNLSKFWRDWPVGSKLAVLASLLVLIVVVALTVLSVRREQASFRQDLEDQADLLLNTLPLTMRDPLYFLELDELLEVALVVAENDNVTFVEIYDDEGKLLIAGENPRAVFGQEADPLGQQLVQGENGDLYLQWQDEQLLTGTGIWLGNQPIGAIAVGLSTAPLDAKLAGLTRQSLLLAAISLASGVGLALLFARQFTNPLSALTQVATNMAGGNLEQRIEPDSDDEVGRLGKAFDRMADAIQRRESDLRELAAGLEKTVGERTAELRQQNEQLVTTNEQLLLARREAEEATRLKSQFLAAMSHELRTPLHAIMGFTQLLQAGTSGEMNQRQLDKLERILKNAEMLLTLINDLLDLSKIEAGRATLLRKEFVLEEWFEGIARELGGLAREKGLVFEPSLDPNLPNIMIGDPVRLKQIVTNLLSNAVKFTEKGEVKINVRQQSTETWTIEVIDTGIGIPSHAQEFIFDEFRQVDGTPQREYGGTGLGLSIVRNLVVMMGGSIRVDSETGKGSTFTVLLPLMSEQMLMKSEDKRTDV